MAERTGEPKRIQITPKGSARLEEWLHQNKISPEDWDNAMNNLGAKIKEILQEYRKDPLGTVIRAGWDEEHGTPNQIVERLLKDLGFK